MEHKQTYKQTNKQTEMITFNYTDKVFFLCRNVKNLKVYKMAV